MMIAEKCVAIMQPYIFPYIGYFHLIQASEILVFYDDVSFIKGGWINRNRIINQDKDLLFTVPLERVSSNKLINETPPKIDANWKNKFYKQLTQNYKSAPFFNETIDMIMSPFSKKYQDITDLAIESILVIHSYLGIRLNYTKSSICSPETGHLDKADRIIEITKKLGYDSYVNAPGGKHIYTKDYFFGKGIQLFFIKSHPIEYRQHHEKFIPFLSIIDVVMFCGKNRTIDFMNSFSLE